MHKMYRIDTQQGTFALKLLNPFVMQRETAMDNFAKAERIELLLEQQGVRFFLHCLWMEEKCRR